MEIRQAAEEDQSQNEKDEDWVKEENDGIREGIF
jgi:hypothetical protein